MTQSMNEIEHYFPNLSALQKKQFGALQELYEEWNERINVISRKDISELYTRHVLHSLSIAKFTHFNAGSHILDVGTGGGFPGIPLAIYFPEVEFVLVDSIGKKIKVVKEVVEAIELENVQAYHTRAEKQKGKFDFVVTRAVAPMQTIVNWTRNSISKTQKNALPNGIIALKGGDLREELKPFRKTVEEVPLSDFYTEDFFETKKLIYLPINN